jgi:hypothetical protein
LRLLRMPHHVLQPDIEAEPLCGAPAVPLSTSVRQVATVDNAAIANKLILLVIVPLPTKVVNRSVSTQYRT